MTIWGAERFAAELAKLGFEPTVAGDLVSVSWTVPLGSHEGETGRIGWQVPTDWPETSPHGPNVSPGFDHPDGGNHDSPFGAGWRHWSRPFNGWAASDRRMRTYMRFMRALFGAT